MPETGPFVNPDLRRRQSDGKEPTVRAEGEWAAQVHADAVRRILGPPTPTAGLRKQVLAARQKIQPARHTPGDQVAADDLVLFGRDYRAVIGPNGNPLAEPAAHGGQRLAG